MRTTLAAVTAIALALLLCPSLRADEKKEMVDNPAYASWAKHKPGTNITLKQEMKAQEISMTHDVVQTLLEVTPEKATVEMNIKLNVAGQTREQKQKMTVPAKVEKGQEYAAPGMKGNLKEVGNEKVEVAGKSYECKVIEFDGDSPQGKSVGKMWRNNEIPGTLAKLDVNFEGQMKGVVHMTVTGIDLK